MTTDAEKLEKIFEITKRENGFGLSANDTQKIRNILLEPSLTKPFVNHDGYGTIGVNGRFCAVLPYPDVTPEQLTKIAKGEAEYMKALGLPIRGAYAD